MSLLESSSIVKGSTDCQHRRSVILTCESMVIREFVVKEGDVVEFDR